MMQLQRKVKIERFFGGANHKQTKEERLLGVSNEALSSGWAKAHKPIVVTDVPEEFSKELTSKQVDELTSGQPDNETNNSSTKGKEATK